MRLTVCIARRQDDETRWTNATAAEGLVGQTLNIFISGGSTQAKIVHAWARWRSRDGRHRAMTLAQVA